MAKEVRDKESDGAARQLKLLGLLAVGTCLVPLLVYVLYVDRKLNDFQDTLRHSPPEQLSSDSAGRADLHPLATSQSEGQVVYVPAYSHVYHGKGTPHLLTITLSVRNTSLTDEIVVKSVRYFDTKGSAVKSFLKKPVRLPTLATTEVIVERNDAAGGSGANFLVEWYANHPVTPPIVEAVMIDTVSQQGISFVCRGTVIGEFVPSAQQPAVESQPED